MGLCTVLQFKRPFAAYIRDIVIVIKYLYSATKIRVTPDPGQCRHLQRGKFSG